MNTFQAIADSVDRENLMRLAAEPDHGKRPVLEDLLHDVPLGKIFAAIPKAGRRPWNRRRWSS